MTVYYNEIDPYAAAWLRNLIAAGHIAPGDVDERSIEDVRPDELRGYTQCHFFAGIGVWSYALRNAGWPDSRPVWTGSCPCQPFSAAGKGGGFADERHLWPAFHHLIRECGPDVVFGEQVASKDGLAWLDLVQADLEGSAYASGAIDLCAAGVGAPHIRQRLWWCAERLEYAELPSGERQRLVSGSALRIKDAAGPTGNGVADRLDRNSGDAGLFQGRAAASCVGLGYSERIGTGRDAGTSAGAQGGPLLRPERDGVGPPGAVGGGLADTHGGHAGAERQQPGGEQRQQPEDGRTLHNGRPGPTNGLWRDADWLFCRDGKWRPVEPRPQSVVDGAAVSLGRVRTGQVRGLEIEIAEWAIRHEADPGEALHDLRRTLSEDAERERSPGRLPDLHGAAFLLAFLRQLTEQGWAFAERLPGEGAKAPEADMRVLRHLAALARTPRQRGLDGQPAGERADALRVLSSILARHAQEAWGRAHDAHAALGFPLAVGARERVGRLRGYGNAIVAQAAQAFIEAYLDARHPVLDLRLTNVSEITPDVGCNEGIFA